jgi:hypothetical protein
MVGFSLSVRSFTYLKMRRVTGKPLGGGFLLKRGIDRIAFKTIVLYTVVKIGMQIATNRLLVNINYW